MPEMSEPQPEKATESADTGNPLSKSRPESPACPSVEQDKRGRELRKNKKIPLTELLTRYRKDLLRMSRGHHFWVNIAVVATLILLGILLIYISQKVVSYSLYHSVLENFGSALIAIALLTLTFELLTRRSYIDLIERKVESVFYQVVPASLGELRDSGIIAVFNHLDIEKLRTKLTNVRNSNIRILKMWIPEVNLLEDILVDLVARQGCSVQILLLNPDSTQAIKKRAGAGRSDPELMKLQIGNCLQTLKSVRARLLELKLDTDMVNNNFQVRLHRSFVAMSLIGYGTTFLMGLYWHGVLATNGPQLKIEGCDKLMYKRADSHFNAEWDAADKDLFESPQDSESPSMTS